PGKRPSSPAAQRRVLLRNSRRRLRNERPATGDLRLTTALVAAAFPRDPAGLLPPRKPGGPDRLRHGRPMGARGHPLFPALSPGHAGGNSARPLAQPPPAWRRFFPIPLRRPDRDRHSSGAASVAEG